MGIPGEEHILDGFEFIEQSKLDAHRPASRAQRRGHRRGKYGDRLRDDCQTSGRQPVTMIYRRSEKEMTAYPHEYDFMKKEGVALLRF